MKIDRNYLRLYPLLFLFALLILASFGLFGGKKEFAYDSPMIGKRVSFFDLPIIYGDAIRFTPEMWDGKVAVVNFFASWCEPCAAEHAALMKLSQMPGIDIYGVAWKDSQDNIMKWLQQRGSPYRVVGLDTYGKSAITFGMAGVPETYVIDREGTVAYVYRSQLTDEVVKDEIMPLIAKLQSSNVTTAP